MAQTAIAERVVVLPLVQVEPLARDRIRGARPRAWQRLRGWLKELLAFVALIYMFPVAVLVIGIPLALVINGLLIAAGWAWTGVQ